MRLLLYIWIYTDSTIHKFIKRKVLYDYSVVPNSHTYTEANAIMSVAPYSPSPVSNHTSPAPAETHDMTGLIIGSSVGGVVLLIIIIVIVFLFLRRRRFDSGGSFSYASDLYHGDLDDDESSGCCRGSWCCCKRDDSREGRFISSTSSSYLEI